MDRDYTGNVGVILGNIGTPTLSVQLGHRIAQLICECIAVPVPTKVSELGTTVRGNSGFGSTGITAVQVQPLELHEPINSATFPVLDGSLLSRLAFLWAGFLPQMASLFLYSTVQTGPGCSGADCSNQGDRADPGCSNPASLPSCAVSLPPQSGRIMVGYRVQPKQRPVALFEAEAQQLLDNLVCSEDPSGEADIFHIHHLEQWETEIPDCGSGRAGEVHGHRTDHPAALYPDDFMGGFGHSCSFTESVLMAHMSASEDAPLMEEALQLAGRLYPPLSEYMYEYSISALQDAGSSSESSAMREPPRAVQDRQPRVRQKKSRSTGDDLQFRSVLSAAAEQWASEYGLRPTVDAFCRSKSDCLVTHSGVKRFRTRNQDAFQQSWLDEHLWLHPPNGLWENCVSKILGDQARGLALVPTMKHERWWRVLGEFAVDWVHFSDPSQTSEPSSVTRDLKTPYRLIFFDAMGADRERGGSPSPNQFADPQRGGSQKDYWEPVRKIFRKRRPVNKSTDTVPSSTALSCPPSAPPISGADVLLLPSSQDQKRAKARQKISQKRRQRRGQSGMHTSDIVSPSPQTDTDCSASECCGSTTECGMTSESESEPEYCKYGYKNDFDSRSAPTACGHQETGVQVQNLCYPRSVQSVIQTDLEHPDCQMYREQLLSSFKDTLFTPRGYEEDANEHPGPKAILRLDLVDNPQPMSFKAIRSVGVREVALREKIDSFL